MKRSLFLMFILMVFTSVVYSQDVDNIDFISPMNEGMAAVKKGNQWGFINAEGDLAIDYRDDLVVSNMADNNFPVFQNGRCLITQKKDGISYFGYIDTSGKTVIEPQYLNATPFKDHRAIVLLLRRTELSHNTALNKPVVNYDYFEVVINEDGKILSNLTEDPIVIALSQTNLRRPPVINSKIISESVFATVNAQKKWSIVKVD